MVNSLENYQLLELQNTPDGHSFAGEFNKRPIAIHKFGGSSLANSQALLNVSDIILSETESEDFIVVSANGKVTDWLLNFAKGNSKNLDKIKNYYHQLVTECLIEPLEFLTHFDFQITQLTKEAYSQDEILAHGELWSASLLVALLQQKNIPALFIDARDILKTDSIDNFNRFDINYFDLAIEKILYGNYATRLVVTGYIAKNVLDKTITLGRNGSDYTASLLAFLTDAKSVTLWTDVKGIYDADPNIIKSAKPVSHLSFHEAQLLASVGTHVLHSKTIAPLEDKQIPLYVRSSIEPEHCGTCISSCSANVLASKDNIVHLNQPQSRIKSIAVKQELIKLVISSYQIAHYDFILQGLANAGIFYRKLCFNFSKQRLAILIEKSSLSETIELLNNFKLDYSVEKEEHTLVAIIGKEFSYQKSFLQILQKILSLQYQFQIIHSNFNDLFLISTTDKNSLDFFELIYHCCSSTDFCQQASRTFSGDYSLFAKAKTSIDRKTNNLITSEVTQ